MRGLGTGDLKLTMLHSLFPQDDAIPVSAQALTGFCFMFFWKAFAVMGVYEIGQL